MCFPQAHQEFFHTLQFSKSCEPNALYNTLLLYNLAFSFWKETYEMKQVSQRRGSPLHSIIYTHFNFRWRFNFTPTNPQESTLTVDVVQNAINLKTWKFKYEKPIDTIHFFLHILHESDARVQQHALNRLSVLVTNFTTLCAGHSRGDVPPNFFNKRSCTEGRQIYYKTSIFGIQI